MSSNRPLGTLLQSLQITNVEQDTARLFPTAASLLITLTNPLNVSLLTTQLLNAPAIWDHQEGLSTLAGVFHIFHSASATLAQLENQHVRPNQPIKEPGLKTEVWIRAVLKGLNNKSPQWRHLLPLGGLQLGFTGQNQQALMPGLRSDLDEGLVMAINSITSNPSQGPEEYCAAFVMGHVFDLLSEWRRNEINHDVLLPVILQVALFSSEGFQSGYFIGALDSDIVQTRGSKFTWPSNSGTYFHVQKMNGNTLITSMGRLARLMAYSLQRVNRGIVQQAINILLEFSEIVYTQWRANKLSEVDVSEESTFLTNEAIHTTIPALWQLLKMALFSSVAVLKGALDRMLTDSSLGLHRDAANMSMDILKTLRNFYFISSRIGSDALSMNTFVFLSAIDILARYPDQAQIFLASIKPSAQGRIPPHPLDRCLDLFFLNTAEPLSLAVSPEANEELLVASASPYLVAGKSQSLLEISEAAHSVILAIMAAPRNSQIAGRVFPFYTDALFKVFPSSISARQFCIAFKTLVRISSPPSAISHTFPDLTVILLEMLYDRALNPPTIPLPELRIHGAPRDDPKKPLLSEQAHLALALLDALPFLSVALLEEWLPIAARLVNQIRDVAMADLCRERFWEKLVSGEMDVERSQLCVMWWTSRGGRDLVLFGSTQLNLPDYAGKVSGSTPGLL